MRASNNKGIDELVNKIGAVLKKDKSIFHKLLSGKLGEITRSSLENLKDALTYVQKGGTCPHRQEEYEKSKTTHYCSFPMNNVAGFVCPMYSKKKIKVLVSDPITTIANVKEHHCKLSVKNEDSNELNRNMINTAYQLMSTSNRKRNGKIAEYYLDKRARFLKNTINAKDFRDKYTPADQERINNIYKQVLTEQYVLLKSRLFEKN